MSNRLHDSDWPSVLPSRAEVAPQVSALLPSWDASGTISGVVDFDGYVVAVSDGYRKLFGWTPAEITSAPYWEFVHTEDQHRLVESLEQLMMQTSDVPFPVDVRTLCRDGTCRWTQWQTVADPTSELIYALGEDMSDGRHAEEDRFHLGTWVRDFDAGTVDWSEEIFEMFGLPVGTTVDDDLLETLIHPRDFALVNAWRDAIADDDYRAAQFRVTRHDGTIRTLRSTGRVTSRADGHPVIMRGLTMDITNRRQPN